MDVAENLNPALFGKIVKKARSHVDELGVGGEKVACDLHRLVRRKVDYEEYANFRHPPRECLERGGNCVDTTCLFCSLLIRAGFECRIVSVSLRDRGHMFAEVLIRGPHEKLHDNIIDYYTDRQFLGEINTASMDSDEPGCRWVIADPATSDFLGDTTGLRELGYMRNSAETENEPQLVGKTDRYRVHFG